MEENLYETSKNNNKQKYSDKLIPYEIRECDEDNYDDLTPKEPILHKNLRKSGKIPSREELAISHKFITYNLSKCEQHKSTENHK
jgi:hypothetical protein